MKLPTIVSLCLPPKSPASDNSNFVLSLLRSHSEFRAFKAHCFFVCLCVNFEIVGYEGISKTFETKNASRYLLVLHYVFLRTPAAVREKLPKYYSGQFFCLLLPMYVPGFTWEVKCPSSSPYTFTYPLYYDSALAS